MTGSFLRYLRGESNLDQATLAGVAGVSQGHMSDLERGRRDMTSSFAMKAAPVLGVDAVTLLSAHEFEKIARKAEEGDPAAPHEALALAKRLLELVEEPGALDEEQAAQIQEIVSQLIRVMEGKPIDAPRVVPPGKKPVVPLEPVAKASGSDVMGTLWRLGAGRGVEALDEDEAYARLVEEGLSAQSLEQLLDDISARMSGTLVSDAERLTLEALQAAIERRIAELAGDGERPSEQVLAGDRAAIKSRRRQESRESKEHTESMEALGLDMYGRPIPQARRDHERALKSASFLSQDEKELGTDYRGLPLDPQRLRNRRYVELGE